MNTSRGVWVLLSAALLLVSCGGGDNDSREAQMEAMAKKHGIDADVSLDEDGEVASVVIEQGYGGARVGTNLELPDGFPDDVPVSSDWTIMAVSPTPGGYMINGSTERTVDEALAAVRQQLTAEGWTETGFSNSNSVMTQVGFSKDERITNINLMDTGANRSVQLVTMQKP